MDEVVFAEPGDLQLLGARSLEGFNARVDSQRKTVVAAGPIPAAGSGDASDMHEPPHVHVKKDRRAAKFWLEPIVLLAKNRGYRPYELNKVQALVEANRDHLLEAWHAFFGR